MSGHISSKRCFAGKKWVADSMEQSFQKQRKMIAPDRQEVLQGDVMKSLN